MSKFKSKYKWADREKHFAVIDEYRKIVENMGKIIVDGCQSFKSYEDYVTGGIVEGLHWIPEDLEKIKNGTCITKESALEKVAGTTNPVLSNDSSHSFDDFGLVHRRDEPIHFKFIIPDE